MVESDPGHGQDVRSQNGGGHRARRALAVRAGNEQDPQPQVGTLQVFQGTPHSVQAQPDAVLAERRQVFEIESAFRIHGLHRHSLLTPVHNI